MLETMLKLSLYGGIAAVVVMLLRLLPKLRPNVKFLLWCLVFVRLVLPPGLLNAPAAVSLVSIVPERAVEAALPARSPQKETQSGAQTPEGAALQHTEAAFDWMGLFEAVWLAGVACSVLTLAVFYMRVLRKERHETAVKGVYMSDHVRSPMVIGVFRPKIVLPCGVHPEAAQYILLHERAHIRRGDHVTKLLFLLVAAAHWFNPIVWLAYRLAVRDMEMAVDEAVLRASAGDGRKAYATELLHAAGGHTAAFPGFGESDVKKRIRRILDFKKPSRWIAAASVLLVIAAAVFLLAGGKAAPADEGGQTPNSLVPSLMVENALYFTTGREVSDPIEDGAILGKVASTVPISQWPAQNGQANIPYQDAPYARYENGIVLFMDGKWVYFEPRDEGAVSTAPTATPAETPKSIGFTTRGADDIMAFFTVALPADCEADLHMYDATYRRGGYYAGNISMIAYYDDGSYGQLMNNHTEQIAEYEQTQVSFQNGGAWAAGIEQIVIGHYNSDDYNDVHSGRTYDHITYNVILAEVKSLINRYTKEEQFYQNCIQLDFVTTYYEADGTPVTVFTEEEILAAVQSFSIKNDKPYEPAMSYTDMYELAEQTIIDALYEGATPEARAVYAAMGSPETIEYLSWGASMVAENGARMLLLSYAEVGMRATVRINMDTGEMLGLTWSEVQPTPTPAPAP